MVYLFPTTHCSGYIHHDGPTKLYKAESLFQFIIIETQNTHQNIRVTCTHPHRDIESATPTLSFLREGIYTEDNAESTVLGSGRVLSRTPHYSGDVDYRLPKKLCCVRISLPLRYLVTE